MSPTKPRSSDQYGFLEGMRRIGQEALGQEILEAIEKATWKEEASPDPHNHRMWIGTTPGYRFVVADFEIESQGFRGERAADGMVTCLRQPMVIRLGHELSAHAVVLARKQNGIV